MGPVHTWYILLNPANGAQRFGSHTNKRKLALVEKQNVDTVVLIHQILSQFYSINMGRLAEMQRKLLEVRSYDIF